MHSHPDGGNYTTASPGDKESAKAELNKNSTGYIYHPNSEKMYQFDETGITNSTSATTYEQC